MPNKCSECQFCTLAGVRMERLLCMFTLRGEVRELIDNKLPDCPLIELPENHGRLIDANIAYNKIIEEEHKNDTDKDNIYTGLLKTPTIFNAE